MICFDLQDQLREAFHQFFLGSKCEKWLCLEALRDPQELYGIPFSQRPRGALTIGRTLNLGNICMLSMQKCALLMSHNRHTFSASKHLLRNLETKPTRWEPWGTETSQP